MDTEIGQQVITLVVTMTVKPEFEAAFLAVTSNFIAWVRANEPGTLLYTLTKDQDTENTFTWVERYRDEAALRIHGESDNIKAARAEVGPMLAQPASRMRLVDTTP